MSAVASRDKARAAQYADEWQIPIALGSYEALLGSDVDVIYNPLPNHLHLEWTLRAVEAGKHVLCEKPLVLKPGDVDEIAEAAERAGVVVTEAFMYRHHPPVHRVCELIHEGAIGEPRLIRGVFTFTLDRGEANYRLDPAAGGGALWDVGCYPVSFARSVLGEEPQGFAAEAVVGPSGVDMRFAGAMRFPSGVIANFQCGFDTPFESEMTVVGSLGRITVPLAFQPGPESTVEVVRGDHREILAVPGLDPLFLGEVEDMERAVLEGGKPLIGLADSRGNVAALTALMEAAGL